MSPVKEDQMTTLEKKIQHFSRILATRPGDELTILALAEASFRRGLKLEALTAYQQVGSRAVPEAHLAVAEIYSDQGMPTEAYGELRRLFELDPENVEARLLVHSLQAEVAPPEDLNEWLQTSVSDEALEEARLRLKIQRAIYNRELQERTRNVTLDPGTVINEYHMEEAKKKLIRVDELLRELDKFREYNANLVAEPPRAEVVSPMAEPEDTPEFEHVSEIETHVDWVEAVESDEETEVELALSETADSIELDVSEFPLEVEEEGERSDELSLVSEPSEEFVEAELPVGLEMAPLSMAAVDEASGSSYSSSEFGLESPVDPDLPDPEVESESEAELEPETSELELEVTEQESASVPFVDLEPIEMGVEDMGMISLDMPEPTFRDAPPSEELEPVNAVMPILDESVTLMTPEAEEPEELVAEDTADWVEPEPEAEPESVSEPEPEARAVEPASVSVDTEPSREFSLARKSFYEAHSEALSGLTTTLARTRGVTSIFLVAREGLTIDSAAKDDISEERVGDLVRESFEFLEAFAKDPAYWVLECAGGIFVMQKLDDRHVLIAIGQAGANFGALRYTMDKTRTKFEQLLAQAPE